MKWLTRIGTGMLSLTVLVSLTGCIVLQRPDQYLVNRYYDLRDTFDVGAGVTTESPESGIVPAALGAHVQITDFAQLGWIRFSGYSAESDMRGAFAGPEQFTQAGFLWWQYFQKNQDYDRGLWNYFKNGNSLWSQRMESYALMLKGRPAKRLHYDHYAPYAIQGNALLHQGWHYWGYTGANFAICEPFLSHMGVHARLGFDPSEVSDFALGWLMLDFKGDDMRADEYKQWTGSRFGHLPQPRSAQGSSFSSRQPATGVVGAEPPTGTQPAEPLRGETLGASYATVYFDYDRDGVRKDQTANIEQNIAFLTSHPDAKVMVVGHCDERGTTEYNYNLGMRRAQSVKAYMVNHGVAADRIDVQSKGKDQPAVLGHNEAAWSKNRRAETQQLIIIDAKSK